MVRLLGQQRHGGHLNQSQKSGVHFLLRKLRKELVLGLEREQVWALVLE